MGTKQLRKELSCTFCYAGSSFQMSWLVKVEQKPSLWRLCLWWRENSLLFLSYRFWCVHIRKNIVHTGFATTCHFRHPLGGSGLHPPHIRGSYCIMVQVWLIYPPTPSSNPSHLCLYRINYINLLNGLGCAVKWIYICFNHSLTAVYSDYICGIFLLLFQRYCNECSSKSIVAYFYKFI